MKPSRTGSATILLFIIAGLIFIAGRAPFFGQWDSFDYLKQTATHRLSDLAFGRPVFIGYNILLWETAKRLFGLSILQVSNVVLAGVILTGAVGVLLFRRLAGLLLPAPSSQMATLAFLLAPLYVVYSGSVMTEVPMLAAVLATALVLWEWGDRHPALAPLAGGVLFGLAIGIREQAVTLGAAFLWILWERRPGLSSRVRACFLFAAAGALVTLAPVAFLYLHDPPAFVSRTRIWLHAIPMSRIHLVKNAEASLLFTLAVCPAVWLAILGALVFCGLRNAVAVFRRALPVKVSRPTENTPTNAGRIAHPVCAIICGFVFPLAVLWRDADVQMHPRYLLILLPSAVLMGVGIYRYFMPSARAAVAWALLQILVFALAAILLQPLRQIQIEKKLFAEHLMNSISGRGLLITGSFSPVADYYRGLGVRPGWQVLWSGWGWSQAKVENSIRQAWKDQLPVYLCDGPYGWLMLEDERLDLHFILNDHKRETVAPGITRYYPSTATSR